MEKRKHVNVYNTKEIREWLKETTDYDLWFLSGMVDAEKSLRRKVVGPKK